jgi:hypothetical protein
MTQRLACPPAPGPLEDDAARFDELFDSLAPRRGFREYLQRRLLPRERNKTLPPNACSSSSPKPPGTSRR